MNKDNKTKPVSLLEVGDNYVQASWSHPDSNTEIIGIYRFDTDTESWVMDQPLRGPWSVIKGGVVVNDSSIAATAFMDASGHAMALFTLLRTDGVKIAKELWQKAGGTVYDL